MTTESITLQDVELGSFAIDFVWSRLAQQRGSSCFDIVALDPNPATGRDEVNHPHVNDLDLCAGDAGPAPLTFTTRPPPFVSNRNPSWLNRAAIDHEI